jgi:hypothetical protein
MKIIEEEYDVSMNELLFNKTIEAFDLEDHPIPFFIKSYPYVYTKILSLLSFYIKPNDHRYQHLKLY